MIKNNLFEIFIRTRKIFLNLFFVLIVIACTNKYTFATNSSDIPIEVLNLMNKKGYENPEEIQIWRDVYKNYTNVYCVYKKKNNKKYRYILYKKNSCRFATNTEKTKHLEGRYF